MLHHHYPPRPRPPPFRFPPPHHAYVSLALVDFPLVRGGICCILLHLHYPPPPITTKLLITHDINNINQSTYLNS